MIPTAPHRTDPFRPWAVGYVSTPYPVGRATWVRWLSGVETHAAQLGLPLADIFSDGPGARAAGMSALVDLVRQRVHLRTGHVGVLLVPDLQHLARTRDGSQDLLRLLFDLHFGVKVVVVQESASNPAPLDRRQVCVDPRFAGLPASVLTVRDRAVKEVAGS